jgi:hypothetical protein
MQTNPLVLQEKIITSFKNSSSFKDPISPDETGITNSLIAAVLQRRLLFQRKHYNLIKRRKKLFTRSSYFDTKNNTYGPRKTKETCRKSREKHNFVQILDPSRAIDEEFRRKPKLMDNPSNLIEFHQGSSSYYNFQYFTKEFFNTLNPDILRFLEFRERLYLIKNFDVMNFTKTYTSIQIEEDFKIYQPCVKEPYLGTAVPGLKGIVANLRHISERIGAQLFKEIVICIHLSGRFPTKLFDYAVSVMYEKIAEFKIYFRSVKKEKKLIKTMVRLNLKPMVKYRNNLRK